MILNGLRKQMLITPQYTIATEAPPTSMSKTVISPTTRRAQPVVAPLRVLQFITPAGFYGAERWVLALANNTDPEQVVCDLAVTREGPEQDLRVATEYPSKAGDVHYLDMHGRFDLRVLRQLCAVIRSRRIDVIHTHGYKSDLLGLIAARRTGIRAVSTPHGFSGSVGWKLALYIKVGTRALRHFDQVVPLSAALVLDMARLGVPSSRVRLIENGVDLTELVPYQRPVAMAPTQAAGSLTPAPHIGFVGQMIARKGLPDLLRAFDEIHRQWPGARLTLLGDGAQRAELEALADSLACADAITFAGFRSDRLAIMASFDLFLMTSSLEGIPRCLMEAMALGTPVVAYDIPGVDQLITDQETGVLVAPGCWQALARASMSLLADPGYAQALASNARHHIEQRFSARRMAGEYEHVYRQLLDKEIGLTSSFR